MDTDGEAFRSRAYHAEEIMDLLIKFLEEKGLYNEYMHWKENKLYGKFIQNNPVEEQNPKSQLTKDNLSTCGVDNKE